MPFYKVTWAEQPGRATVYNWGCNFRCKGCTYQLKRAARPEAFTEVEAIQDTLIRLQPKRVHFMGGEPTTCPDLPELLRFCKRELGATTWLGHTNGSGRILEDLDGANVGFKGFHAGRFEAYTGRALRDKVYANFEASVRAGLQMRANGILIPGHTEAPELVEMARFIAALDPDIPFHLMGYIPVPGTPWRAPTDAELREAVQLMQEDLRQVTSSLLTPEDAIGLTRKDSRFASQRVL